MLLLKVGYLASLGQARTAEVKRDAIIGLTTISIRKYHKYSFMNKYDDIIIYCTVGLHSMREGVKNL